MSLREFGSWNSSYETSVFMPLIVIAGMLCGLRKYWASRRLRTERQQLVACADTLDSDLGYQPVAIWPTTGEKKKAKIREAMADLAIVRKPRPDPATPSTNTFPCQKPDGTRSELPMSIGLSKLLKEMEIDALLPIQTATFQAVLDGKDVIGRSHTGTGKTLAFCLPLTEKMLQISEPSLDPTCIVLSPTRDLAQQTEKVFRSTLRHSRHKTTLLVGGVPMESQFEALDAGNVGVVVGTPGRLCELARLKRLTLSQLRYIVVDEADEMLKQGFQDEMEYLLAFAPQNAQALLFCATMTPALHSIANDFCKPGMVSIDLVKDSASATAAADAEQRASATAKGLAVAPTVTHEVLPVHPHARVGVIADILVTRAPRKAIVFVNTRHEAAAVARELWQIGLQSVATWDGCWPLHGDMPQEERSAALKEFRTEGRLKVLVATDVAARGMDVSGVELVLHCGLPVTQHSAARRVGGQGVKIHIENFTHRCGRTGRAGSLGTSLLLYDPGAGEAKQLPKLAARLNIVFQRTHCPSAEEVAAAYAAGSAGHVRRFTGGAEMLPDAFAGQAERLQAELGAGALAAALAALAGLSAMPPSRSLLTSRPGFRTVQAVPVEEDGDAEAPAEGEAQPSGLRPKEISAAVKEVYPKEKLGRVVCCSDGSVVFDLANNRALNLCQQPWPPPNVTSRVAHFLLPDRMPEVAVPQQKGGQARQDTGTGPDSDAPQE
uniref:RNA helicase n=1 Tax=Eutreptiella gymnastica TaxID=73025 RepID=A0A6T2F6Q1_9EUGL